MKSCTANAETPSKKSEWRTNKQTNTEKNVNITTQTNTEKNVSITTQTNTEKYIHQYKIQTNTDERKERTLA